MRRMMPDRVRVGFAGGSQRRSCVTSQRVRPGSVRRAHRQAGNEGRTRVNGKRFGVVIVAAVAMAATLALSAASSDGRHDREHAAKAQKFVFFASDGMRQDLIAKYLDRKSELAQFLKKGVRAAGNGLLTQAPPNTGAGWYSLATGAWPGVHGSTNNTFHINGQSFGSATSFSSPNVLQAETLAQSAERGGKKVAQIEWVGGRSGTIKGPTLDFRSFLSGRGVVTN